MTPILGFQPDADQRTPGLLSNCSNLIPDVVGMKGAPSAQTPSDVPALAAACLGAAVITKLDGTRRTFAGASDAIYELVAGVWDDVSAAGGYNSGADTLWSIAQFGDTTIMSNRVDPMQAATSGDFADIAGAPKAEIVFSVGAFVMAMNVNDGAEKPDGWHNCAAFDATDWTEDPATQSNSGRLVSTPGPITAGLRLGEYAVAYKSDAIYLGQYVGSPSVWDWTQVPGGESGSVGKRAICDIGGVHFFVGQDNFWLFDGTSAIPVADGKVKRWFADNSNPEFLYKTVCVFEKSDNRVWIFYPSEASETLDAVLVYHVRNKEFGRATMSIETALEYISAGATIDGLDDYSATIDGLPDVSFDSPFWLTGTRALSVFNTSHQLQTLTGASVSSSLTTGEVGDDDAVSLLQQIRLRYSTAPTSATVQTYAAMNSGEDFMAGPSGTMNDGKFDCLKASKLHKATASFTGPVTVTHMNAKFKQAGTR
jgi:hypothetical protein